MKKVLKIIGILIVAYIAIYTYKSFFNEEKIPQKTEIVKDIRKAEVVKYDEATKKRIKNEIFKEFKRLYVELNKFKKSEEFITRGFAGKQKEWLKKVEKLRDNPDSKLLLQDRIIVGELSAIAIEYMQSKGKGTESSKLLEKEMRKAIRSYIK